MKLTECPECGSKNIIDNEGDMMCQDCYFTCLNYQKDPQPQETPQEES